MPLSLSLSLIMGSRRREAMLRRVFLESKVVQQCVRTACGVYNSQFSEVGYCMI
jgi:hypothetical protein